MRSLSLSFARSLSPALGICPDLQLVVSSSADLWQWHMSCVGEGWGGRRGDEGVILVRSPVRVRVCPHVKGWACLAQNTDCTSSTNLCPKKHLQVGWGGGRMTVHIWERQMRGFKAAFKFLGCEEGLGRTRGGVDGSGGRRAAYWRFCSCKADLAEAKPERLPL